MIGVNSAPIPAGSRRDIADTMCRLGLARRADVEGVAERPTPPAAARQRNLTGSRRAL